MTANAAAAIDQLKVAFPNKVTTPATASSFQKQVDTPWSQTCWTSAAGYVELETAKEVADALAIIKQTGSKFTVRTTGHNPNAGFSSADETAVVLDIHKLQSKELTPEGVARIGGGSNWGDVYAWLENHGRSATGGRQKVVGLGGFLLGGTLFIYGLKAI